MWIAISNRGLSKPDFRLSKSVDVNSNIYFNELYKHHADFNYLFWPDLVGAHYSNETVVCVEENVHLVEIASNPPHFPQAKKVYVGGWQASIQQDLISRIQR